VYSAFRATLTGIIPRSDAPLLSISLSLFLSLSLSLDPLGSLRKATLVEDLHGISALVADASAKGEGARREIVQARGPTGPENLQGKIRKNDPRVACASF